MFLVKIMATTDESLSSRKQRIVDKGQDLNKDLLGQISSGNKKLEKANEVNQKKINRMSAISCPIDFNFNKFLKFFQNIVNYS